MEPLSMDHFIFFCLSALLANYMWWVMPPLVASPKMVRTFRILVGVAAIGGGITIMIVGVA